MKGKRYELILIDADDTLFDFGACENEALRAAFADEGLLFDESVAAAYREINAAAWLRVEKGLATQAKIKYERFELLLERLGAERGVRAIRGRRDCPDPRSLAETYIASLSGQRTLIEDAERIVAYLSSRYRLVMVTNGIARVQRGRFGQSPLSRYFIDIAISEEIGAAKPDPRIFEKALAIGGSPEKARVLMIGDSLSSDIAGAIAFGIDSCWFNSSGAPAGSARPTFEIQRLAELEGIL